MHFKFAFPIRCAALSLIGASACTDPRTEQPREIYDRYVWEWTVPGETSSGTMIEEDAGIASEDMSFCDLFPEANGCETVTDPVMDAGLDAQEDAGPNPSCDDDEVMDAGPADDEVMDAGSADDEVMDAGSADDEVMDAGSADDEVMDAGSADDEVMDAGSADDEIMDAGPSDDEVMDAGPSDDCGPDCVMDAGLGHSLMAE